MTQLIYSCEDTPLKNLIEAAAKQWIDGTISPLRNNYGVIVEDGHYVSLNNQSCLISSAMIGEKSSCVNIPGPDLHHPRIVEVALKRDVSKKFNITEKKINDIICIFDGESEASDYSGVIIETLYEILFL